jgi:formylglycine-generating enzyme required for sulfatase activity
MKLKFVYFALLWCFVSSVVIAEDFSKSVVELPLTSDGKVDFLALFSPPPPLSPPPPKLKERDAFETKEEFAARKAEFDFDRESANQAKEFTARMQEFETYRHQLIATFNQAVSKHDPRVQAGTAYLEKQNYDVDTAIFAVNLEWANWMRERFALDAVVRISVARDVAKNLFEEGQKKSLFVTFQINDSRKVVSSNGFLVGLGKEINVLMSPTQDFVARDTLKDGGLGPELVWISPGTFQMGSNNESDSEKPVHTVSLKGFAMGKYEVTFEEYDKYCKATGIMNNSGSDDDEPRETRGGRKPARQVTWGEAKGYVEWLSEQTGKDYRLPSEAQWEYACRAGGTGKYSFGDDVGQLKNYGWYDDGNSTHQMHPVGEKQPNRFGLYDMHGNAWEWVKDGYHKNYSGAPTDGSAWVNNDDWDHVIRGGSWRFTGDHASCSKRNADDGFFKNYYSWGFRISRM